MTVLELEMKIASLRGLITRMNEEFSIYAITQVIKCYELILTHRLDLKRN